MAGLPVWLLWSLAVADSVPSLFNLMAGLPVWLLWSLAGADLVSTCVATLESSWG